MAVSLAKRRPEVVGALVLENTFTSIPAMVDLLMPYLRHFKALVLRIKWNSLQIIGDLTQPILFISGVWILLVCESNLYVHLCAN